jgi:hypothetical protein
MKTKLNAFEQLFITMMCCFSMQQSLAQANRTLSNLLSPTKVNISMLPGINNRIDLGSANFTWRNIYAGTSYYINGTPVLQITGTANTFVGNSSNTVNAGSYNTYTGNLAGQFNTTGNSNTAHGYVAINSNTTGSLNTAFGAQSLYSNISGNYNTASGFGALYANQYGDYNTAVGYQALNWNTSGGLNTAVGVGALYYNTSYFNTATGYQALYSNSTGSYNTAMGDQALLNNTTGSYNSASGIYSLIDNTTGGYNTALGVDALAQNNGSYNTATGFYALISNTAGIYNTSMGYAAFSGTTNSWGNTALGYIAGAHYNNGYYNTFIGSETDATGPDIYNSTALGRGTIIDAPSEVRIGNSFVTSIGGYVGWTNISDGRVKKNIKANVPGLAFINKLQPVTYNLDLDAADRIVQKAPAKTPDGKPIQTSPLELASRKQKELIIYTGFVAQDVEKVAHEMSFDFSGIDAAKNEKGLYGLRYSDFVPPLVKAVQDLSAENEELKKRLSKLEALVLGNGQPLSSGWLEQNAPNPADGTCYIAYYIPSDARQAQLTFTDATGRVLKTYSITASGYGKQLFNSNEIASGIYQYSLTVDGKLVDTKKMVVAR